jgi:glutamate synthase (NADPH/NADH) small chain
VQLPLTEITWDTAAAEKDGYEHFMLKEIHEQPKAVRDTLNSLVKDGRISLAETGLTDGMLRGIGRIDIVACGSREPRRMEIPGADLDGVHFAVDYLTEVTRALLDGDKPALSAEGKDVFVIGGGDTGVDCVACALRQGARSVRQIIRAACPPDAAHAQGEWPAPRTFYTQGYGQAEAEALHGEDPRTWSTDTVGFVDDGAGHVGAIQTASIPDDGVVTEMPAQMALIAKGFVGPEQSVVDAFAAFDNAYLAGDAHLGSTLVVTAIADALDVAGHVADGLTVR